MGTRHHWLVQNTSRTKSFTFTMTRPSRSELLTKFFPELQKSTGSIGDKDAAIAVNARACEAIIQDLIGEFDKGHRIHGPGILAIRLTRSKKVKPSGFVSLEDLRKDRELAGKCNDTDIAKALDEVITVVKNFNVKKAVALMLQDNSGFRLLPINRESPAKSIVAMMEDLQS